MPGTPPTSPYYLVPRYANQDPADFSTDVNAIVDTFDAKLGVRREDTVVVAADYAAKPGDLVVVTGVHTVTLPQAPADQTSVTVLALNGDQTVRVGSGDSITQWSTTGLTNVTVKGKTVQQLRYHAGVWFCVQATQVAGGVASGTFDALAINAQAITTLMLADGAVTSDKLDPAVNNSIRQPGDLVFSAATARVGCVLCDGTAYGRTDPTYAALFAAIGTAYGNGDGSTTFNVPDFRQRVIVGAGAVAGDNARPTNRSRGQVGGEQNHTLAVAEMPSHNHNGTTGNDSPDHTHGYTAPLQNTVFAAGVQAGVWQVAAGAATAGASTRHTHSIPSQGGGGSHNTMPPFGVANVFIKL